MAPCGICSVQTQAASAEKIFTSEGCSILRLFVKFDMGITSVCFGCYIRFGTIIVLLTKYSARRAYNSSKPEDDTQRCHFCKTNKPVRAFDSKSIPYLEFINSKLTTGQGITSITCICCKCGYLIKLLVNTLMKYHESKALPDFNDLSDSETNNNINGSS